MGEKLIQDDRDSPPHISNSHPKTVPQQTARNSQPQSNDSGNTFAPQKQHNNYNRA
jgi:hypothetical protein